jgi:hypothetical protein
VGQAALSERGSVGQHESWYVLRTAEGQILFLITSFGGSAIPHYSPSYSIEYRVRPMVGDSMSGDRLMKVGLGSAAPHTG